MTAVKKRRNSKPTESPRKQNSKYQMPGKCDLYGFEVIVGPVPSGGEYVTFILILSEPYKYLIPK